MSDIHGQWVKYQRMLEAIHFSDCDVLYILGDFVDRGADGVRILLDVMERPNIIPLVGNHDWTMMALFSTRNKLIDRIGEQKVKGLFDLWFSDGGLPTYRQFQALTEKQKSDVLNFVNEMRFICEVDIKGEHYFMAHTVPEYDGKPLTDHLAEDFIHGEPSYDIEYNSEITIITGHTPTELIDPAYANRIWKGNRHIAIDCGAGFDGRLGCLCLENMQEYYR